MGVRIAHARMNENKKANGGMLGDQTGEEIAITQWYEKGWVYYVECLDEKMADSAARYAEQIALDPDFGYSQDNRWTAWKSIVKFGYNISEAKGDLDCASFIIVSYIMAGLKIAATGYTASLRRILEATGKFKVYTDAEHVSTCNYAKRGSLYIRPKTSTEGGHVFMVLDNGPSATSSVSIAKPYVEIIGKANVRTGGSTSFKSIGIARVGEKYKYLGSADTGWHKIDFKGITAFISNKVALTRLIQ